MRGTRVTTSRFRSMNQRVLGIEVAILRMHFSIRETQMGLATRLLALMGPCTVMGEPETLEVELVHIVVQTAMMVLGTIIDRRTP